MNIRFLETAVNLAELLNFRMTAERMNITPAAISNRITTIEQELGIRIFDRDAREVSVTADGEVFLRHAREIVRAYHGMLAELAPGLPEDGTIRIGILPSLALTILPAVAETIRRRFPRVRLAITTETASALQAKLARHELDILLGFPPADTRNLRIQPLCRLGMFWVAASGYPGCDGPLTAGELLNFPIISYESGSQTHQKTIEYFGTLATDATFHYSNALTTTISMVEGGIGIAVLPPVIIQEQLRSGSLKVLDVQPRFPVLEYSQIWLDPSPSPLPRAVAQFVRESVAEFCAGFDGSIAMMPDITT